MPKSVQKEHMQENLQLERLPDDLFEVVSRLRSDSGPIRFLDLSRHMGFDIFDEDKDQPVDDTAPWDSM